MERYGDPMSAHGDLWGPMGPLGPHGDPCRPLGTFRDLWGVLGTFGDIQGPMGTYGDLWGLFPESGCLVFFPAFSYWLDLSNPLIFIIFFLGGGGINFLHPHFDTNPPPSSKHHTYIKHITHLVVYTTNTTCHVRHQASDFIHNPAFHSKVAATKASSPPPPLPKRKQSSLGCHDRLSLCLPMSHA